MSHSCREFPCAICGCDSLAMHVRRKAEADRLAGRLTDDDVERIARRVVEILREGEP